MTRINLARVRPTPDRIPGLRLLRSWHPDYRYGEPPRWCCRWVLDQRIYTTTREGDLRRRINAAARGDPLARGRLIEGLDRLGRSGNLSRRRASMFARGGAQQPGLERAARVADALIARARARMDARIG